MLITAARLNGNLASRQIGHVAKLINYSYLLGSAVRTMWLVFEKSFGNKVAEVEPFLLLKVYFCNFICETFDDTLCSCFVNFIGQLCFCSVSLPKIKLQKLYLRNFIFICISVRQFSLTNLVFIVYRPKVVEIKLRQFYLPN